MENSPQSIRFGQKGQQESHNVALKPEAHLEYVKCKMGIFLHMQTLMELPALSLVFYKI